MCLYWIIVKNPSRLDDFLPRDDEKPSSSICFTIARISIAQQFSNEYDCRLSFVGKLYRRQNSIKNSPAAETSLQAKFSNSVSRTNHFNRLLFILEVESKCCSTVSSRFCKSRFRGDIGLFMVLLFFQTRMLLDIHLKYLRTSTVNCRSIDIQDHCCPVFYIKQNDKIYLIYA